MALVKPSILVEELAGKAGNVVFFRGPGSQRVRNQAIPIDRRTPSQVAQRGYMSTISKRWSDITESQRNAWNVAAASPEWTQKDRFGVPFQMSGEQLYCKLNLRMIQQGNTPLTDPPARHAFAELGLGAITATSSPQAFTIAYTGTLEATDVWIVRASAQVSVGKMSSNSVYTVEIGGGTSATPIDILADYTAKFGTLIAGRKIFVELWQSSDLTGEDTIVGTGTVIVAG